MTHRQTGVGERATVKAHTAQPNPARPYGVSTSISLVDAYQGRSIGGVRDQSAPTDGRGI